MSGTSGPAEPQVGSGPPPPPGPADPTAPAAGGNRSAGLGSTHGGHGSATSDLHPQAGAPWATSLSDLVINAVDRVKAKGTLRALTLLRLVVYGVVILATLVTALVLGLIGVVRIWDVYVPLSPVGRRVWLGYVVLGGALFLAGAWLLTSSRAKAE